MEFSLALPLEFIIALRINPVELKRKITKLQNKLLKLNALKQKVREDLLEKSAEPSSRFEYIST